MKAKHQSENFEQWVEQHKEEIVKGTTQILDLMEDIWQAGYDQAWKDLAKASTQTRPGLTKYYGDQDSPNPV